MEDNNNQINVIGERGGYWYTYADKEGSTVWPVPGDQGGTFTMVEGGHDSKFAAEMKGKLAGKSIVYAAMGLNFMDPKEPLNASDYEGITFWAKRAAEHRRQADHQVARRQHRSRRPGLQRLLQRLRLRRQRWRASGSASCCRSTI